MEKGELLSPGPHTISLIDDTFHSGFQQLIQHNTNSELYSQKDKHTISHLGSNPHSRYSSPVPQVDMMPVFDHHTPINQASPYAVPSYPGGYQASYAIDPSPYPQLPDIGHSTTPVNGYSTPATSPPTPVPNDGVMTTRSGRAITRSSLANTRPSLSNTLTRPAGVKKEVSKPRPARRRKKAGDDDRLERGAILLGKPLSQLVQDLTNVIDTDIQSYVNRSALARQQEVEQSKNGKVKRPMNAFMLYRKAYQNRTKEWKRLDDIRRREERVNEGKPEKGHDNHQVISQVCGLSWNMEPQELRDQYDEWAKIERNNHKIAFPDYKFAPAKSKIKKAGSGGSVSRHDDGGSVDDNASNLDDYDIHDWHSGPPSRNTMRNARYHEQDLDMVFVPAPGYNSVYASPSPNLQHTRLPGGYAAHARQPHPSSFQYSNPGKPRPAEYGAALGQGQYYQQTTEFTQQSYPHHHYGGQVPYGMHPHHHHHPHPAYIENVYANKTDSPGSSFHGSPQLGHSYELITPPTSTQNPQHRMQTPHSRPHQHQSFRHAAEYHHQIDPSLMSTTPQEGRENYGLGIFYEGGNNGFGTSDYHQLDPTSTNTTESPHPQQFDQAYLTPNETNEPPPAEDSSWQDEVVSGDDFDKPLSVGDQVGFKFDINDIDKILDTTGDSPT
ncbi:hypothetical protein GGS20DRAFT_394910 [Poronia punctata]|nr:hypothetical protein GGS20DRAFT_394910 [Poronia punctata]